VDKLIRPLSLIKLNNKFQLNPRIAYADEATAEPNPMISREELK